MSNIQHGISNDEKKEMSEKEKNKENNLKKFDLQEWFTTLIPKLLYHAHSQAPAWEC